MRRLRSAGAALGWGQGPAFLIVGAQKAGTSALFDYLSRHPDLVPSVEKETYFFNPEAVVGWRPHPHHAVLDRVLQEGFDPVSDSALSWYHSLFPLGNRRGLRFEATPGYLYFEHSPRRIRAYRPEMKLIVLLRDPVERAYSAWNMMRSFTEPPYVELREERPFAEAVEHEISRLGIDPQTVGTDYVRRGIYHEQLKRLFGEFSREQVHILESTELRERRLPTLQAICRFLGVPPFLEPLKELQPVLVGNYAERIPADARELLARFYAPQNEALFELLGRRFDWTR